MGKENLFAFKSNCLPSYKLMSMRKHIVIPSINSINLLPNVAELDVQNETTNPCTERLREKYAKIVLLLFYPFRTQDDLKVHGSFWKKYKLVLSEKNIQDKYTSMPKHSRC